MKPSQILDGAADVIGERGWWQGGFVPPRTHRFDLNDCPVCALGAINVASGIFPHDPMSADGYRAGLVLAKYLGIATDLERLSLAVVIGDGWNDNPDRTAGQVIAELRAAAASEREAGR